MKLVCLASRAVVVAAVLLSACPWPAEAQTWSGGVSSSGTTNIDDNTRLVRTAPFSVSDGTLNFNGDLSGLDALGHEVVSGGVQNFIGVDSSMWVFGAHTVIGGEQNFVGGNSFLDLKGTSAVDGGVQSFLSAGSFLRVGSSSSVSGGTQNFIANYSRALVELGGLITGGTQTFSGDGTRLSLSDAESAITGGEQRFVGEAAHLTVADLGSVAGGIQTFTGWQSTLDANGTYAVIGGTHRFDGHGTAFLVNAPGAVQGGSTILVGDARMVVGAVNGLQGGSIDFQTGPGGSGTLQLGGVDASVGLITSSGTAGIIANTGTGSIVVTVNVDTLSGTFGGAFQDGTGTLAVTKTGTGRWVLTGTNHGYTGGTTLAGGTISILRSQNLGTSGTVVFDGGTLQTAAAVSLVNHPLVIATGGGTIDTNGFDSTFETFTGTATFSKVGAGTLTVVGGSNSFGGSLVVNDGSLRLFTGRTLVLNAVDGATVSGSIINDGRLIFDGSADATATISGVGQVVKSGTGKVVVSGGNSFSGGTTLFDGTLGVGTDTALGTGDLTIRGGTIRAEIGPRTLANAVHLDGDFGLGRATGFSGPVDLLRDVTIIPLNPDAGGTDAARFDGPISGAHRITIVAGPNPTSVVFSGSNSYSGGTTLAPDGVLQVGSALALGTTGAISFEGGTLQFSAGNTLDYSGRFSHAGGQAVRLDTNGQEVAIGSPLPSPGGSLIKLGSGVLHVTTANTYGGGTTLNEGTLSIDHDAALGPGLITINGGTIRAGGDVRTLPNSIVMNGDFSLGRYTNFSGSLSLGADVTITSANPDVAPLGGSTVSGVVSGPHALSISGGANQSGTIVLSGSNTYTGGTTLTDVIEVSITRDASLGAAGQSLAITNSTLTSAGDVFGSRAVTVGGWLGATFNTSVGFATFGAVSGTGPVTKNGANILTFTGPSSYTGSTFVNAGLLKIEDGSLASPLTTVAAGATLAFSNRGVMTGDVTGSGTFVRGGAGATVMSGRVDPGVRVVVDSGTLQIAGNALAALQADVAAGATLSFTGSSSFSGEIVGSGRVVREGAGRTVMTGHIVPGIDVIIAGGTLEVTNTGLTGHVRTDGVLLYNHNGNVPSPASISGTGSLVVSGSAVFQPLHDNAFTGGTLITGGGLVGLNTNQGLGTGPVQIEAAGKLAVQDGVRPANDIVLAGGTYVVLIEPGTESNLGASRSELPGGRATSAMIASLTTGSLLQLDTSFSGSSSAINDALRLSDVYAIHHGAADQFSYVLELTVGGSQGAYLGWRDGAGLWVNAREGNSGNNPLYDAPFSGSFQEFQAIHGTDLVTTMGAWGTYQHAGMTQVWTVLNHASEFALVPEPAGLGFVIAAAAASFVWRLRGSASRRK